MAQTIRTPANFVPAPSGQHERGKRKYLERVQAEEMRHAQIAMVAAPARARQSGPAVRRANRVGAGDGHAVPRPRAASCSAVGCVISPPVIAPTIVMVMPRRRAHPIAGSEKRCRHSATATATAAIVCGEDRDPHDREEDAVERGADIEVTGGTAPCLHVDDDDFENERSGGDPAYDAARCGPLAKIAEHPRERQRVDADRCGKLCWLHPRGSARYLARVHQQRHACRDQERGHQHAHGGEPAVRVPEHLHRRFHVHVSLA